MNYREEICGQISDQPLFVLKYRRFHVFLRIMVFIFMFILFAGFALFPIRGAIDYLYKLVLLFLTLLSIRSIIELIVCQGDTTLQ